MTWSQWQVLRVVGLATLMLIGVALVLGVGYYVPQRPAIALLAALFVCALRPDADGLRHRPAV